MKKSYLLLISFLLIHGGIMLAKPAKKLSLSKLPEYREIVWKAWCEELAAKDTLPRISMAALSEESTMSWQLPEELEPSATMNFYSGVKGDKPDAGYPAFVYLHGSGPRMIEWFTGHKLAMDFEDSPSLYVIPQIPNEGKYYRWWQQSKQWAWGHLLQQLLANPAVDPARLYLFGISEGGYGSQRLASFYADYLAAAAPMAGGEPLRNAPAENLCQTAFSLVTGEQDVMFYRNLLTARTKHRLDSLERMTPGEYVHRVYLEKDKGHHITYGVSTPWMMTHRRNAQPKHFRWENYEMDGQKRNCFYNLEVLEEHCKERCDYEFTVVDNTIRLEVKDVEYIITERDPQYGIELNNTRRYTKAEHGKVRIYLSEQMANLSKPVSLFVNGKHMSSQKPQLLRETLEQSCRLFGDPLRLFPAVIEVEW